MPFFFLEGKLIDFSVLNGYFTSQRLLELLTNHIVVGVSSLQKHQFRDGCFYRTIVAADDMGKFQLEPRVVAFHLYASCQALTDVDDIDAPMSGFVKKSHDPRRLWCIARSVCSHDDTAQVGGVYDMLYDGVLNSWE